MPTDANSALITRIVNSLSSLQDLQLFLLLAEDGSRWWDARSIAAEVGMSVPDARMGLDRLAANNLLDLRVTDEVRYCYRPGTEELERAGAAFVSAYKRNPAAMARVIADGSRPG